MGVCMAVTGLGDHLHAVFGRQQCAQALALGLEKLTAQMTTDQRASIAMFESMGFRAEALLARHVRDRSGKELFKEKPATACPYCAVVQAPGQAKATTVAQTTVDGFDLSPTASATDATFLFRRSMTPASQLPACWALRSATRIPARAP